MKDSLKLIKISVPRLLLVLLLMLAGRSPLAESSWQRSELMWDSVKPRVTVTSIGHSGLSGKLGKYINFLRKELLKQIPDQHTKIIIRQAIVESGWFTSREFLEGNNPFGLSWEGEVQIFSSLEEACEEYYNQIYVKYAGGDYYKFLKDLPYAMDSLYIWKLKHLNIEL
jgi:hypothetical protein